MLNLGRARSSSCRAGNILSIAVGTLLMITPAAAAISVDGQSRILILSGYSAELEKQELPPNDVPLNSVLQALQSDLQKLSPANADYFSESRLAQRLKLEGLATGDSTLIRKLFSKRGDNLLITTDITKTNDQGVVNVTVNFSRLLTDGSEAEREIIREQKLSAAQQDMNNLRQTIFDYLKGKHSESGLTLRKTVHISCFVPSFVATRGLTDQLSLAIQLSKAITEQLIDFYHTKKMRDQGYVPLISAGAYRWEPSEKGITCIPVVKPVADPDYSIIGKVAVIRPERTKDYGSDGVDVRFDVTFKDCVPSWIIHDDFPRAMYRRQEEYAASFLEKKLSTEYEREWKAKVEGRMCH
jgi:hypothetical protein